MLKPIVGEPVKIHAADLKPGMIILRDGERWDVSEVDIDWTEENAVSVCYWDEENNGWCTSYRLKSIVTVEYAIGQNLVNIL